MIIPVANVMNRVDEYFFSSKLRMIAEMKAKGLPVINLGIGNPDEVPDKNVILSVIDSFNTSDSHGYQSYKGNPELLKAFAQWYKRYFNVDFEAEKNFLPMNGSKEGISFILHSFVNPGDEVLVPNPGYPTYTAASLLNYANVKTYSLLPENKFMPDFDELQKLISPKTKILFVNYPNMPTGQAATTEFFQKLVNFAQTNKILVVNDNPYVFLFDEQISIFNVQGAEKVAIELNSLSKSHNMAGWRVGVAVGNEEYIKTLLKIRSNFNSGLFKPIQDAAIEALSADENWYQKQRQHYNQRRIIAEKALTNLGFSVAKGQKGMFVWAKIPKDFINSEEVSDFLLQQANVFVTPGNIFGSNGEKFIRISLCNDVDILFEAFRRINPIFLRLRATNKFEHFSNAQI